MKLELPYVQEEAVANFKVIRYFWHSLCVYAVLCKVMQSNYDDFRRFVSSKFQKRPPNERSLILLKTAEKLHISPNFFCVTFEEYYSFHCVLLIYVIVLA